MKKIVCAVLAAVLTLSLLSACGGREEAPQVDLTAFAQSLLQNHEFGMGVQSLDLEEDYAQQTVEAYLPGLMEMDLEQRVIYMSLMRINNGEFSMVQTKNEEDAAQVKDIFQARIDYMAQGGAFYAEPTRLWAQNAQVAVNGNYVMMVCAEDSGQIVDEFNALFD